MIKERQGTADKKLKAHRLQGAQESWQLSNKASEKGCGQAFL